MPAETATQKLSAMSVPSSVPLLIEVRAEGEAIRVNADVTATQARRVLRWARSLDAARDRRPKLTRREREVLARFADGLSYKQIAADLEISIETVRTYVRSMYRKLGVHSVTEAVGRAFRDGLV